MARIAHISDIHFGRIAHPDIVDVLVEDINQSDVDLVVASGDLTQRAFGHQFRAARAMLDRFHAPWLAVPGNHDVFPWWRTGSRLADPVRRFRRYITDDLNPRRPVGDAWVVGINSAHGWTVKGGKLTQQDCDAIRDGFAEAPVGAARVLVVHHHLSLLADLGPHDVTRGARRALEAAADARVDIVLCGHLHVSHVAHVDSWCSEKQHRRVIVASAGTATSSRGRGPHKDSNFYNIVETSDATIRIIERRFDRDTAGFVCKADRTMDRA